MATARRLHGSQVSGRSLDDLHAGVKVDESHACSGMEWIISAGIHRGLSGLPPRTQSRCQLEDAAPRLAEAGELAPLQRPFGQLPNRGLAPEPVLPTPGARTTAPSALPAGPSGRYQTLQ